MPRINRDHHGISGSVWPEFTAGVSAYSSVQAAGSQQRSRQDAIKLVVHFVGLAAAPATDAAVVH